MSAERVKTLRPDNKGRLNFGDLLAGVSSVRVSVEEDGKIILEPQTEIPLREAWLYENEQTLQRVRNGLKQASEGRLQDLGRFSDT